MKKKIVFALVSLIAITAYAGNRMKIQGREVLLDGRPYMAHGMIHMGVDQLTNLRKIGINSLSIDLGFNAYDPKKSDTENKKAYDGVLKMAEEAHKNGQTILWLFSFHYTPDWLWQRYPDVRMKKFDGTNGGGGWMEMSLNHPGFRADAEKWVTFMATLLNKYPATIGYILWNEPHLFSEVDYNPHTIKAFHQWLAGKYKTVEAMNKTWGTSVKDFTDVKAPAPRATTYWLQQYDRMATEKMKVQSAVARNDNPAIWMDWMRFRQENFAAFWKWEADILRKVRPDTIITTKIVPLDLYGSHAYGAGTNTEMWVNTFLDVLGMDLYSHMDDDFLARWKCDYFYSLSAGKPVWHTECNFSFVNERGLPTAAQWRTGFYYQLARGVNGFWNYHWSDDAYALVYKKGKFAPVTYEIAKISDQMKKLAPVLQGMKPAPAQVAVLHSTTTGLALSGDYAPTADQSTIIDLLYRSHTPFEFITEDMIRKGGLKKYRLLVAVGGAALPEDVVTAIRKFTDENGGHILANARFAELDDYGRNRPDRASWMGVKVNGLHRQPRLKTGTLQFTRQARTVEDKPITAKVKIDTWSSRPIKLATGQVLGKGNIYGNQDAQFDWSCNGRHELYWEDIEVLPNGKMIGAFEDGKPAMVETPQTLYIARDTCWVDENFETFFRSFLGRCGVDNANRVVFKGTEKPVSSVDLRMWEGGGKKLLFVVNSVQTLHYDGKPVDVEITFDSFGEVTDVLTGKTVPSRWKDFKRVIPLKLQAGDVRIFSGLSYTPGWQTAKEQYEEVKKYYRPSEKPYIAFRRSPSQLWVYDNRTELGMGMHGIGDDHLDLVRKLGIRLVRHTVYWNTIEKTEKPGVYDPEGLKYFDEAVERAKKKGIELELIIHGNAPGVNWSARQAGYERFAQFAAFMAKRYPSVKYWELWNEMDAAFTDLFGANRPDFPAFEKGRCYAQMLKKAYPAIKQANPKAWVLIGGISSGWPVDFIRGIYEEGGRDYFDFMNIHTYGVPVNWGMMAQGFAAKMAMAQYGDGDRPLWNTEFGIDAGNLWTAWKMSGGEGFDQGQLGQWKTCIEEAWKDGLYWKILPYQFYAGNESANDALKDPKNSIALPSGHVPDDYGFGILRRDGKTPRPTYEWLLRAQINKSIQKNPVLTTNVELPWDGSWKPQESPYEISSGTIILKKVKIDSLEPTVITVKTNR
jgi:beta-galactosidase GanA